MTEIFLYDPIEAGSAKAFAPELKRAGSGPLSLRINSVGGDVFEGLAIYNALRRHPGRVTVHIDGIAASISSVIAMAASEIRIAANGAIMVHDPAGVVGGTASDMARMAETLQMVGASIRAAYARTRQPAETIAGWMANETWFNASEALAAGLVDAIDEPMALAASLDLSRFENVPPAIATALGRRPPAQSSSKEIPMDEITERPEEKASANDINTLRAAYRSASVLGLGAAEVDGLLDAGVVASALPERLIQLHAEREAARAPRMSNIPIGDSLRYEDTSADIEAAIAARLTGRAVAGNKWCGRRLIDMAAACLQRSGLNISSMSVTDITNAAHTTSDFPKLLAGGANRTLLGFFELARSPLVPISARVERPDFKLSTSVRLSETEPLLLVGEGGEIVYGSLKEAGESWKLATYAKIISLSRQAIINDDLAAFSRLLQQMAASTAAVEADQLFSLLSAANFAGPTLSGYADATDNVALFHANHGNLAGAGAAIDTVTLGAAISAMRQQKGLLKNSYINVAPRYLLVGPANEIKARQVVGSVVADSISNVNPWTGLLEVLVEPRFGASTNWYVFSSPDAMPVIEAGNLSGQTGPQLATQDGFDVLGTSFRCVYDFGCAVIDFRGAYRNPGS